MHHHHNGLGVLNVGKEMGNNNTSGLIEEDKTVEDKPVQGFDHADDLKGPNHGVPATGDKEEVNMETEGDKSLKDAGRTDYEKEQNHEVVASEDIHVIGKDEKEVKGQDHLVPAAEDKNTRGNEMEPAYLEHDGLASSLIEDWEHGDKEQDNSTILELEEIPLNEAASTDEKNAGASLVPSGGDESTHGTKTDLVSSGRDGTEYPCVDEQKHDEKEKSINTKDGAEEQSSKEAEEAKGKDRLVPRAEDKTTQGYEMESASLEHDGLASPFTEDPKHDQREQDTSSIHEVEEIDLKESASTDETNAESGLVPAGGDESTHGSEAGLVLHDCDGMEHPCSGKPKQDEKEDDIDRNDQNVEQSLQEAAGTDVIDRQGQLLAVVDDNATYGNKTCLVSGDLEGTTDLQSDNSNEHEKEEDYNTIPVDKEDSMPEAGYAEEEKGQDHSFPTAEDKNARGNEIGSASLDHDGLASPNIEDLEHGEKEQDTSTILEVEETTLKGVSTDETNAEGRLVPAGGDENSHETEIGLVFGDRDGMECPSVDEQKYDEKEEDITINDEAEEESSQEATSTDVLDRQGQLLPEVEGKTTNGNETGLVSGDPDGTADIHGDKLLEKMVLTGLIEEDKTVEDKPVQGFDHADDLKGPNHGVPATGDKEEVNTKTEGEKSLKDAGRTDYEKEQNHEVVASEDIHVIGKDEKEVKGQDHLVPAAEDKNTRGNEMEPAYLEHDGLASSLIEDWEHGDKEQDNSTILELEEIPLNEAASTDEKNAGASLVPSGGDESTHGTETDLVSSGRDGTEYPCVDEQKHEKSINTNDGAEEQSSKEAEEAKGQDRLVPRAEDKTSQGDEMESASLEHDGLASPFTEDPKHDQREQDTSSIHEVEEIDSKESASTDETNAKSGLVPAGGDESTHGSETGLVLHDCDGMEHPCSGKPKQDEKEDDIDRNDQNVEQSLQEAAGTDVIDRQGQLLAVDDDKATYGNKTCLVSSDPEGTTDLHRDNSNEHEKEEDNNTIPVDKEDSMTEAGYAEEEKGQDHSFPTAEDKNARGNEIGSASLDRDGLASPNIEDLEHGEKEQDTSTILEVEETTLKGVSTDETNAEGRLVPAGGDENSHEIEIGLVFGDRDGMECLSVDEQKYDEKEEDITINDEAEEESSQEATSTDVLDRQGQLLPEVEGKTTNGNETGLVSGDPDGTADIDGDKLKEHEKEMNNTNDEPQEKPLEKDYREDDIEEENLIVPAVEGEDCNNEEVELASGYLEIVGKEQAKTELDPPAESTEHDIGPSEVAGECSETQPDSSLKNLEDHETQKEPNSEENLSARTHHFESQNSMTEESEGSSNSLSGAASPTSHDSVPQEPVVVLETEEYEPVEILTEQLVLNCNGPVKSEDMTIPSLTCCDQENGFRLDCIVSTEPVKSVFPDRSPEAGKGREVILVEEMASKEVSTEEKFELKDGDMLGDDVGTITTVMTDLPIGVGAKCNGELPSQMNSTRTDSPESEVEAIPSDETRNILVGVSESGFEDKGMVLNKQAHCQIQSGEELIKKPNVQRTEEGSTANDQSAFSPQFMMNGQATVLENGHSIQQQKDSQQEVQLATDFADTFLMDQINKEGETEEKIIEEQFISHSCDPIANGDYNNQRESMERLSMESNPDNTTMRKSPSFDLDLRIDARAEDSDQTPLLYQDKTTIDSFSSQPDMAEIENGETPSHYESTAAQGKGVTLERSDSEKSKTPFLGFLKEDEEADNNHNNNNKNSDSNMLVNPKEQDDQSATMKTTASKVSVSVKAVMSGTTKGKVKRKPRASLFGTCMCCATV